MQNGTLNPCGWFDYSARLGEWVVDGVKCTEPGAGDVGYGGSAWGARTDTEWRVLYLGRFRVSDVPDFGRPFNIASRDATGGFSSSLPVSTSPLSHRLPQNLGSSLLSVLLRFYLQSQPRHPTTSSGERSQVTVLISNACREPRPRYAADPGPNHQKAQRLRFDDRQQPRKRPPVIEPFMLEASAGRAGWGGGPGPCASRRVIDRFTGLRA